MIAWYVHHHGSGHTNRALAIASALSTPVVGLSTRPAPAGWPGGWVCLDDDADADPGSDSDVTAGGTLHWAPLHHDGYRSRMAAIGALLGGGDVGLLVADVSVEVSVLARLHGVPVAIVAQPGVRDDAAHRLAYAQAALLLAPWPEDPARPWPPEWGARTRHVGAVSRYDGRPAVPVPGGRRVLVLWGSGGVGVTMAQVASAAAATPGWTWQVAGAAASDALPANCTSLGWVDEAWPLLCGADVVVTHAGQNALAEVAAARRPAVVVAQERPFSEQLVTAAALDRAGLAVVEAGWPAPGRWGAVLARACALGGSGWSRWSSGDGARRAARELEALL